MRVFFVIASLAFCWGCGHRNSIPGNILPPDQMRKIIWDMMRTDAYVSDFLAKDSSKNLSAESIRLYEEVFKLHHTNGDAFRKSLAFYQVHPDLFKVITDSLRSDEKKAMEPPPPVEIPETDTLATKTTKDSVLKRRGILKKAFEK